MTSGQNNPEESIDPCELQRWINIDLGIEGTRRIVRDDDNTLLISKFEIGFAAGVHELLSQTPELFEEQSVAEAYERETHQGGDRLSAWHRGMHAMLREAGNREGISDLRQAEIRAGIDSVYAILSTVLWTNPSIEDSYTPSEGERDAYQEALSSLSEERDLFTRIYGQFKGRVVVNHCPGASVARLMLEQGWSACTGYDPPT